MKKSPTKLLNYTTEIEALRTAGEIMGLLAAKGATAIGIEYSNAEPIGLSFKIPVQRTEISFRLPCNYEGALRALKRCAQPRYQTDAQAKRVAWRIVKDWVEAQLAIVECEQAEMAEVFLPYAILANGQTLFQRIISDPSRMLNAPTESNEQDTVIEGRFGR